MDPISDMLIRIKNAQKAGKETVHIPYSKFKHEIAKALETNKFFTVLGKKGKRVKRFLEIQLNGADDKRAVNGVMLLSKPSRRMYLGYSDMRPSKRGGIVLLTTPKGIMNSMEAKKQKVGGQLIAEIW